MKATTFAFLTETTCGEACWHAKEDICRCCCGGKNHGILLTPDGVQPTRNSKIDGYRYELLAVGFRNEIIDQCRDLMNSLPPRKIDRVTDTLTYTYKWQETDKGSPYRLKYATPQQCMLWQELSAYKDMERRDFILQGPSLLWKLVEV
jgi:hypothetical protein